MLVAILRNFLGLGISRLPRLGVAHQLDGAHAAETANVSDQRPLLLPATCAQFKMLSESGGPGEQAFLFDRFDRGQRRGARSWVPAEGAAKRSDAGRVHDFRAAGHGGYGHAAAEGFRHGDQIRLDAEMFRSEPFAGAREAGLHFVRDKENAVLTANVLEQLEIIARRNDEAALTKNGLDD